MYRATLGIEVKISVDYAKPTLQPLSFPSPVPYSINCLVEGMHRYPTSLEYTVGTGTYGKLLPCKAYSSEATWLCSSYGIQPHDIRRLYIDLANQCLKPSRVERSVYLRFESYFGFKFEAIDLSFPLLNTYSKSPRLP